MPNDPVVLPINDPEPTPVPVPAPKPSSRITCDFCKCALTPSGDVFKMSAEAKQFRALEDTIDALKQQLAESEQRLTALAGELREERATHAREVAKNPWSN